MNASCTGKRVMFQRFSPFGCTGYPLLPRSSPPISTHSARIRAARSCCALDQAFETPRLQVDTQTQTDRVWSLRYLSALQQHVPPELQHVHSHEERHARWVPAFIKFVPDVLIINDLWIYTVYVFLIRVVKLCFNKRVVFKVGTVVN